MKLLSQRVEKLGESSTLKMARLATELKEKGIDVISMSLGEPDFHTPDFIKNAAKKAIDENHSFYTPVPGTKELREAIKNKFKRDNNLDYGIDEIVVSTGAKQCIMNIMLAILNPDDEVILPAPFWVSYSEMISFAGGKPVIIKTKIENDFKITPEQLMGAITKNTKAFLFSSPCNPSGMLYTFEELKALVEIFKMYPDILIVSDEIYELITFVGKNPSIGNFHELKGRVITVNGLSKSFAMTGWRLGYMGAPKVIADACSKIQGQFTSGTSSITQKAAVEALKADPSVTEMMRQTFQNRRDLIVKLFKEIPGLKVNNPQGAFYLFPDVSSYYGKTLKGHKIENSDAMTMYLLEEAHVALTPGASFGAPDCIRLSYATSEKNIIEATKRITNALK